MESKIYYNILSNKQREILPSLGFLKQRQVYLAGGTALALQIGHRSSIDFDFYDSKAFKPEDVLRQFQKFIRDISVIQMNEGTLILDTEGIQVSLFHYEYQVIRPFVHAKYLFLLSLEDISAMKLIAIIQRGTKRDFIDIYYLIQRFGLEIIFFYSEEKYPGIFNPYLALQALTYFKDAENEPPGPREGVFDGLPVWDDVKNYLIEVVTEYKKEQIG